MARHLVDDARAAECMTRADVFTKYRDRIADVNGRAAVLAYRDARIFSVLSLDVANARVRAVYVVSDPDKRSSLGSLRFAH